MFKRKELKKPVSDPRNTFGGENKKRCPSQLGSQTIKKGRDGRKLWKHIF